MYVFSNFSHQELEALQSGLEKKAYKASNDAEFIGLQVGQDALHSSVFFLQLLSKLKIWERKYSQHHTQAYFLPRHLANFAKYKHTREAEL